MAHRWAEVRQRCCAWSTAALLCAGCALCTHPPGTLHASRSLRLRLLHHQQRVVSVVLRRRRCGRHVASGWVLGHAGWCCPAQRSACIRSARWLPHVVAALLAIG